MNVKRAGGLIVTLALAAIAVAVLLLILPSQSGYAQGSDQIYVNKQLGREDPVVFVGEYLTFTITIRNDTAFTITTLPLVDTYNAQVLGYADAAPPPDSVDPAAGQIDWSDLTTSFGDLAVGQQITVVVGFIAEHPETAIVNAAEVHDAIGSGGAISDTLGVITGTESVGGSSPVEKVLSSRTIPQVGLPLTFTIIITNQGYTTMTIVPLVDTYNPEWLAFKSAVPPPDEVNAAQGVLTWTDVTLWTGDVPPHETIMVTTVFTALLSGDGMTNQAEVIGATDWYSNDMGGGSDQVPITIIQAPSTPAAPTITPAATDTPQPTNTPRPTDRPQPTDTPVPADTPVPTPVPATETAVTTTTVETTPTPEYLPQTGRSVGLSGGDWLALAAALLALGAGAVLLAHTRRTGTP